MIISKYFKKSTSFWFVLVSGLLILQLFSQYLLIEVAFQQNIVSRHLTKMEKQADYIIHSIKKKINTSIISSDGLYQIIPNVLKLNYPVNNNRSKVSLITHCSLDHLIKIIDILKFWNGPVILSVYTPRNMLSEALQAVFQLHKCHGRILQKVTINLVTDFPCDSFISEPIVNKSKNCDDKSRRFNSRVKNYDNFTYPNNLLRNTGIRTAKTSFIFMVDIDFTPSEHLFEDLSEFLVAPLPQTVMMGRNISKNMDVFVIPAFEIKPQYNVPKDKRTLLKMIAGGSVRPFYIEMCERCHIPTRYNLWKALPLTDRLSVAYTVEWEDPWEPFYVAHKTIPLYDERFRQYGFNRISQSCELHIAGYQFHVLDNAFIVHQGYKTNLTFHPSKGREQRSNRILFRKFKEELKIKYHDSKQRC